MGHPHNHHATVTEATGDENYQVTNSSPELGSASDADAHIPEVPAVATSTEQFRVRVSSDGEAGPATPAVDRIDQTNNHVEAHVSGCGAEAENFRGSNGKSMLPEFDENDDVGSPERNGGVSRDLGHGFEVGDMVWGKVKSHPWWPGHIFSEAFASPSVRRTKKEGHVLVAFFGDSSYGWFEPSELIPFEDNFFEKSRQMNSRAFSKAVDEALDEAGRRCGLGLVCRCRNPDSFRPTNVQGYFSVQVRDYEPGIYSESQIRRARDGFGPAQMLDFIKQLAQAPHSGDHRSVDFAKNRATVCALRRAVFEPHDVTYAQAFGAQPLRPSGPQANPLDQSVSHPTRAPLSGPLVVVAEFLGGEKNTTKPVKAFLGGEKNTTKPVKAKDSFKKDKYRFKRRDEANNSAQLASTSREETPDAGQDFAFQKGPLAMSVAPQVLEKHEDTGFINRDDAASAIKAKVTVKDQVQPDGSGLASQEITLDTKPYLPDKGKESSEEMTTSFEPVDVASKSIVLPSLVDETSYSTHLESKTSIDVKHDGNVILSGPHEDFLQKEQGFLTTTDEVKHPKPSVDGVQKINVHKRPADDLNSESSAVGGKKKKKKKERLNLQPTSGHPEKSSISEKSVHMSGKLIGKPVSIGLAPREDLLSEPVQMEVSPSNLLPECSIPEVNFELPQLLDELQALALDPFHGVKRGIPAVVQQFFLRFRSLVYQKSLLLSPPTENEAPEVCATKSPSSFGASDSPNDHARDSPLVKPVKHVRPDDPAKAGRKRAPSDRQEEITAKRLKKTKDLKTLAAEKKAAGQKTSEARQVEGKESVVQTPPKIVKPGSTRKVERPAKPVEPTVLVIKFPPMTSLPSIAELKARFARFGPMDQSGLRVFWKSSTCRVVFLHKVDAQAAYKFAAANQSLFGNVGVKCFLRESEDSSSDVAEAVKTRGDDGAYETPRIKDPAVIQRQTSGSAQQPFPQPMVQLKSILKKSAGDEIGQGTGNGGSNRGTTPRVKFVLGGEESSRGEQLMVGNRNNFNNASFPDGRAPSPVAMDFNSKNAQKVISQPSLPDLPFPTQFTKIPQHNLHNFEMAPRNTPNFINKTASSAIPTTVDISQQMIFLLTRCHDVVTNLTSSLGYVPYHPL